MKETRFNIGMNTLKQIDGMHGEEVYNTIQEICGFAVCRSSYGP